jgi:hypothetical protein
MKHKEWNPLDDVKSEDVLNNVTFGENVKIDWKKYPMFHRKCWDAQKTEQEMKEYPRKVFSVGESI